MKKSYFKYENKGVSLIALVITIVLIIILASIVIVTGMGSVGEATYSKFVEEFNEFDYRVSMATANKKHKLELSGRSVSNREVNYMIASNKDISNSNEIVASGRTARLNIKPEKLKGKEYYEILDKNDIEGYSKKDNFYSPTEKIYITDEGEVFTLPGFEYKVDNDVRYYVNETKYYLGSDPEIEMITFYIDGDEFETLAGTTWEEFVNEYNETESELFGFMSDNYNNEFVFYYDGIHPAVSGARRNELIKDNYHYETFSPAMGECVKGNTEIYVDLNNNTKLAKDIVEGDSILYYDFENNCLGVGTVTKAYIHKNATNFVKYTFDDGSYIEVTDYHPIYTNNGWKSLTRRNGYEVPQVGDKVKTTTGWKTLQNIETYNGLEDCYDFAIENSNGLAIDNYFGNGTLVQNSIK